MLSGEKQRIGRSYNFPEVISWFAERADRILLLFDAHKLDISDEFKSAIESLRGHDDKIKVVLNKGACTATSDPPGTSISIAQLQRGTAPSSPVAEPPRARDRLLAETQAAVLVRVTHNRISLPSSG